MGQVDELNDKYIRAYLRIAEELLKHNVNETGYTSITVDNNFYLIDSRFISGPFNRNEFNSYATEMPEIPPGLKVTDSFYVYFTITGENHIDRLRIKKLVLQVEKI